MARWSPKGNQVSFLASGTDGRQLYSFSMNGGEVKKITSGNSVKTYEWSPDGSRIAFVALKEAPPQSFNNSFEVGSNDFLKTEAARPNNLWLLDLNTNEAWQTLPDSVNLGTDLATSSLAWSPDSKRIVFSRFATPFSGDSDLRRLVEVNLGSGVVKPLT